MIISQMVLKKEELERINAALVQLTVHGLVRVAMLVDESGQLMASSGEVVELDTISLASLIAGNVAATARMAELLNKADLVTRFQHDDGTQVEITKVARGAILVIMYDSGSARGLVNMWMTKTRKVLDDVFASAERRLADSSETGIGDFSDDEIDNLFS